MMHIVLLILLFDTNESTLSYKLFGNQTWEACTDNAADFYKNTHGMYGKGQELHLYCIDTASGKAQEVVTKQEAGHGNL